MQFVDLFAGAGGFRLGLEALGHECVLSSEIDKYARAVYQYHWEEPAGDVRKIRATDVPDHDILTAGFPCQPFSIAGRRQGFQDIRGTLFAEIIRIAKKKRPKILFLENVRGLLSNNDGRDFHTILLSMGKLGYNVEWEVLNSKNFGVPQNRERVFIVGHLGDPPKKEVFPIGQNEGILNQENPADPGQPQAPVVRPIRTKIDRGEDTFIIHHKRQADEVRIQKNPCVTKHFGTGGGNVPFVMTSQPRCGDPKRGGTGALLSDQYSFTLDRSPHKVILDNDIRKLTPLECERLQGFPDNWTEFGLIDGKKTAISDTQRYLMMGNAVTVNVIEEIARRL